MKNSIISTNKETQRMRLTFFQLRTEVSIDETMVYTQLVILMKGKFNYKILTNNIDSWLVRVFLRGLTVFFF